MIVVMLDPFRRVVRVSIMGPTVVGSRFMWDMPQMVLPHGSLPGSVRWVPLADSLQLGMNMVVATVGLIGQPMVRNLLRSGLLLGTVIELMFLVALKLYEIARLLNIVGVMPLGRFLTRVVTLKTVG